MKNVLIMAAGLLTAGPGAWAQAVYVAQENGGLQPTAATYSVSATGGTLTIQVSRTVGTIGTVGCSYQTVNGTAVAGTDFVAASGTLSWAAGDGTSKPVVITILNDGVASGNKTFTFRLHTPTGTGAFLGVPPTSPATNQEGRVLPAMPAISTSTLWNTTAADAILAASQILPVNNPWNEDISQRPVAANSTAMIGLIGAGTSMALNYDMNFAIVPSNQAAASVALVDYPDESDAGPYPVPPNAPIENWPLLDTRSLADSQQDINPVTGGDRHHFTLDPVTGYIWEYWQMKRNASFAWTASNCAKFNLRSNKLRPAGSPFGTGQGWTSSDAAGLPVLPAIPRYDECERGMVEHALRFTVTNTRNQYVYPGTHYASTKTNPDYPRMAERFRLKKNASVDAKIAAMAKHPKAIALALQKYGMFQADNGGNWRLSMNPDTRLANLNQLTQLIGSDFEVIVPTGPNEGPRQYSSSTITIIDSSSGDTTAPAAVANLAVTGQTSGSITLQWTAPGDDGATGTATSYDVRYSNAAITAANWGAATQATGEPAPTAGGTTQSFTVTLLAASTTYFFAIRASDEVPNQAAVSNSPSGTTSPPPDTTAPAAVANLAATGQTSGSITLQWTAPGDDGATGTATSYDIRYSNAAITLANWGAATQATGEPAPTAGGTTQTFTVTGLAASTTYFFSIRASDEVPNQAGVSNSPSGTTSAPPDVTAPAAVANLAVTGQTSSSITLQWTAPGDDGATGTATSYDIRYSNAAITLATWAAATQATGEPVPTAGGTTQSFTVTGLAASTTYFFSIRASDEVPNQAGVSNSPSGTTLASADVTPPAAVANLAVTGQTSSSITLQWTAPGDDGATGTATSYDIRYSNATITLANWAAATQATGEPAPTAGGTTQSFTVTGLAASTTYFFAIRASDEVPNQAAVSNSPSGTTSAPPASLSVTPGGGFTSSGPVGGPFTPAGMDYVVSNGGASPISFTVTVAAGPPLWLTASSAGGLLDPGASVIVTVGIDPEVAAGMLQGDVTKTVTFTNTTNGVGTTVRTVTLSVGGLAVSDGGTVFSPVGGEGGPFVPSSFTYTLINTDNVTINWTASTSQPWLVLSGTGGTLAPGASVTVTVSLDPGVGALPAGVYTTVVTFTNMTTGVGTTTRDVTLSVAGEDAWPRTGHCGCLGLEALLLVGLAALRRRLRERRNA